ncbi:polyprenyl synthetase family protein [Melioribacter sp. Ez-97]|uniref:polyprenyl synthetase family protein n=1 Tax=Melioribacter sp. Ez-97 TaxID=3423434 RepID=UPI003ED93BFD
MKKEKYELQYGRLLGIIEKRIDKLFNNKKPASLYEPCKYALESGGKRLRPVLLLLSTKAAGGNFNDAYNAALAVEIFHNFTLVHDDIMDNSPIRRGRPSLYKKFDTNTAILAGDNLIAFAYKLLLKDCKKNTNQIIETFTQGIIDVCEGQSLDKEFETRKNVSLEEYRLMISQKTAALLTVCTEIGGLIAGADYNVVRILKNYGKNLGMAFQIQDDLLDIIADEKTFGKKVGSDLIEGKKTYLFLKALEKAKGEDKKKLLRVIKNSGIESDEIESYKKIYEKYGVLEDAIKEIDRYTKSALKGLNKLPDGEGSRMLYWLANSLINRTK